MPQSTPDAPAWVASQSPSARVAPSLLGRAYSGSTAKGVASHRDPTSAVILEKPIRIPRFLSVKASHVLKGFLNKVRL